MNCLQLLPLDVDSAQQTCLCCSSAREDACSCCSVLNSALNCMQQQNRMTTNLRTDEEGVTE